MYQNSKRTCRAFVFLIKSYSFVTFSSPSPEWLLKLLVIIRKPRMKRKTKSGAGIYSNNVVPQKVMSGEGKIGNEEQLRH